MNRNKKQLLRFQNINDPNQNDFLCTCDNIRECFHNIKFSNNKNLYLSQLICNQEYTAPTFRYCYLKYNRTYIILDKITFISDKSSLSTTFLLFDTKLMKTVLYCSEILETTKSMVIEI